MFQYQLKPRDGVAKILSGGEKLFVTESHPGHYLVSNLFPKSLFNFFHK
jgi:hypothetical protein